MEKTPMLQFVWYKHYPECFPSYILLIYIMLDLYVVITICFSCFSLRNCRDYMYNNLQHQLKFALSWLSTREIGTTLQQIAVREKILSWRPLIMRKPKNYTQKYASNFFTWKLPH